MQENMKEYLTEKEAREKRLEIYTEKNTEKNTRGQEYQGSDPRKKK